MVVARAGCRRRARQSRGYPRCCRESRWLARGAGRRVPPPRGRSRGRPHVGLGGARGGRTLGSTAGALAEGLRFMVDGRHHLSGEVQEGTGSESGWEAFAAAGSGSLPHPDAAGRAVRPSPVHPMGYRRVLKVTRRGIRRSKIETAKLGRRSGVVTRNQMDGDGKAEVKAWTDKRLKALPRL